MTLRPPSSRRALGCALAAAALALTGCTGDGAPDAAPASDGSTSAGSSSAAGSAAPTPPTPTETPTETPSAQSPASSSSVPAPATTPPVASDSPSASAPATKPPLYETDPQAYADALPLSAEEIDRRAGVLWETFDAAGLPAADLLTPADRLEMTLMDLDELPSDASLVVGEEECVAAVRARSDHELTTPVWEYEVTLEDEMIADDAGLDFKDSVLESVLLSETDRAADLRRHRENLDEEFHACADVPSAGDLGQADERPFTADGVTFESTSHPGLAFDEDEVWWSLDVERESRRLAYLYTGDPGSLTREEFEAAAAERLLALLDALPAEWPPAQETATAADVPGRDASSQAPASA